MSVSLLARARETEPVPAIIALLGSAIIITANPIQKAKRKKKKNRIGHFRHLVFFSEMYGIVN